MYRVAESYVNPVFNQRKVRAMRDSAVLIPMSEIPSVPVEWLWPGMVPRGKLTLLAGDPGLGKSFITLDMAARASRGLPFPGSDVHTDPVGTVLVGAEDDPADTVRPRLESMGADLTKIRALDCIRQAGGRVSEYIIGEHTQVLERVLEETPEVGLLVVDPVSAYVGGVDSYNNAQVRAMLKPLTDLAANRRVAVVLVTHLRKSEASKLLHRAMGSLAFAAASRVVLAVTKSTDDPDKRFLLTVKSNISDDRVAFTYGIEDGVVVWGEMVDAETLSGSPGGGASPKAEAMEKFVNEVMEVLKRDGRIKSAACLQIGKRFGLGHNRLRASEWKRKAGLVSVRHDNEWWIQRAGGATGDTAIGGTATGDTAIGGTAIGGTA